MRAHTLRAKETLIKQLTESNNNFKCRNALSSAIYYAPMQNDNRSIGNLILARQTEKKVN